ncbi:MAG: Spy/CpxP family protein refolding chaperone [Gammaproteobacteria bacterium]
MNDENQQTPAASNAPKKSRKGRIALIVGGVLLAGAVAAGASASRYCEKGDRMERAMDRISHELELNADQRQKLEELGAVLKEARTTMRDGGGIQAVMTSVKGSSLDRDALNEMANNKIAAAQAQAPKVIAALGDFYDGLDAEQQAEAREKLSWMADKMQHRREGHGKWNRGE